VSSAKFLRKNKIYARYIAPKMAPKKLNAAGGKMREK